MACSSSDDRMSLRCFRGSGVMEYRQIQVIGGKGSAPGQFATSLRSLAVDTHGQLYAAGDSEIKVFDAAGRLKRRWSTARPVHSVAVIGNGAGDGAVYAGGEIDYDRLYQNGDLIRLDGGAYVTFHTAGHDPREAQVQASQVAAP